MILGSFSLDLFSRCVGVAVIIPLTFVSKAKSDFAHPSLYLWVPFVGRAAEQGGDYTVRRRQLAVGFISVWK